MQREEPVGAHGRTHDLRHQADIRFRLRRWPERQLYEVQLTLGRHWSVSALRRLLVCRAKWRSRPGGVIRALEIVVLKPPVEYGHLLAVPQPRGGLGYRGPCQRYDVAQPRPCSRPGDTGR